MDATRTKVRPARISDAAEISRLSEELGYSSEPKEMTRRLREILPEGHHAVIVAAQGERLLGWIHIEHRVSIESGSKCEIVGMVVDTTARRHGVGRNLVQAAEEWAYSRGLTTLTVRSNTARKHSHPFYESIGYERVKTQHVYTKKAK
ncbi:MAG: GNAT family N-acetyltransferase [Methylobacillus sp.]|jgi:GNAT superfamily N-acetyltransferase|nr:GNAT family N-acetyltransferase [Methylobacillus sp.]